MGLPLIPKDLQKRFEFAERDHALAILSTDFPTEFKELLDCLRAFKLQRSHILTPGGGRSPIPIAIDGFLNQLGWREKKFDIKIEVDNKPIPIPTHSIDNFKNGVGI